MLTMRLRWTGQSRAAFERQYLTGSFYLYHSFSVIVAQPLSFTLACKKNDMTHQYDIFISYSHHDSQLAESIYSKLNDTGMRCFLAEKDIAAAERWEDRIRDALRASQRILLLITPNSKDSHWVVAESGAAWVLGKPLIPALAYVSTDELITPITSHQARLVHTPEQIENLIHELSTDGSIVHGNLTGQWRDPSDGDVTYFRQSGNQVVGFYNLGRGDQKLGVYQLFPMAI